MKQKPKGEVDSEGTKSWWLNGKRHREDGPAVEWADGTKWWYLNGKLHREDGPAYEGADGSKAWYLNNVQYTERNFWTKLFELGKITEDDLFLKLL